MTALAWLQSPPVEVFTGPRPPVYSVEVQDGRAVILEDGIVVDTGQDMDPQLAVSEAVRITAFRYRMITTAPIWPATRDPQRLPARRLTIRPAPRAARLWN